MRTPEEPTESHWRTNQANVTTAIEMGGVSPYQIAHEWKVQCKVQSNWSSLNFANS